MVTRHREFTERIPCPLLAFSFVRPVQLRTSWRILSIETLARDGEQGRGNARRMLPALESSILIVLGHERIWNGLETYRAAIAGYVAITDDTWPIVRPAVDLREHSADPDLVAAG